jgi:hypothetical protein
MAKKEVVVSINGKETVSAASQKAEGGLSGFASKAKSMVAGFAALGVGAALGGFFKKAITESLGAQEEMTRLGAAVEGTGASFESMKPRILETITNLNRMSTFSQSDLRNALSNMTVMTGDAEGSMKNLALAADLAAAKNIPLEQAAEAVAKAMAGNETALKKLVPELKNSSDLFGDLQAKVGGTAEKMGNTLSGQITRAKDQFGEFANAVGDAILGTDGLSDGGGILITMMVSLQEWVAENTDTIQLATAALVNMARNIGAILMPAFKLFGAVATPALALVTGVVLEVSFAIRAFAVFVQDAFGKAIQTIAGFAKGVAGLLKKVGIDLNTEGLESMERFGKKMDDEASTRWTKLTDDHKQFWGKLGRQTKDGEQAVEQTMQAATVTQVREVKKRGDAAVTEAERVNRVLSQELGPPLANLIGITTGSLQKLGDTARTQIPPEKAAEFSAHMQSLVDRANAAKEHLIGVGTATDKGKDNTKDMAREVADIARSGVDAASAFGVIDDSAVKSLNSAINIGNALSKIAQSGFSFAGVTGVIGGVASLVNSMMAGDQARRDLLRSNNQALSRLANEFSAFNGKVSGDERERAGKLFTPFAEWLGNIASGQFDDRTLEGILSEQGFTVADIERIAKTMGMSIYDKNGKLNNSAIYQVLGGLASQGSTGRVGTSFQDQLQYFRDSQRVMGTEGPEALQELINFLVNTGGVTALQGIDVLNDPQGAIAALRALFKQLGEGDGIANEMLGKLTGSGFGALLMELIGGLAQSPPAGGGSTGNDAPPPMAPDPVVTGGGLSAPTETIQTVIKAMDLNVVTVLTEHTTLHERIAAATEGSYERLISIDAKMDTLIAVTSGVDRFDRALEEERFALAVQQGRGVSF